MMDKFICGVCGKEHANVANRAACEAACLKRIELEEKRQAEIKMREEKAARTAKLNNIYTQFVNEYNAYIRDYGSYSYDDGEKIDWPKLKSLFHFFM
jgi:DNA repair exonuclease SbcCD ATPase subunit